ncbi:MAG: glucosamine-6-phosphate deaminase [Blautia sp.]|nr:glucosamine-6-phosphate deaminase [Blautia sp.]MDD7728328.1 glucosamine-6-phosphate deaminase [Clostridia bacterium]MDY5664073.1 glucosamine-6-phosphate deaminase [Blautia sp.]
MKLIRTKNYEELSRKAANIIAAQITLKPDCLLGLATGSSPIGTYDNLVSMYESGNLDFSRVRSVNLDEYMGLGGDNDQSYRYFMNKHLFERVNIDMTNTHVPDGTVLDSEKACAAYNALLAEMGTIDLQVLGIGPNGHIGFNEPDDHFAAETHCVDLTDATIQANKRFFENEADVPRKAYTMGIGNIMSAKMIVLVANGKNKAKALAAALKGPVTPQCPASILQFHPNAIIIADEDALSELE